MRKTAMEQLRDKLLLEVENLKEESQTNENAKGYREALINVSNDIDAQMLHIESEMINNLTKAINEIENAMERWHLARDNDDETLEHINQSLVDIGLLGWFNKK